jgi:sortase A
MERTRRLLSYLLVACGAFLLYLGAREVWDSRSGQSDAAREFQQDDAAPSAQPNAEPQGSPERGEALAKLIIPRLDTELYVVEGDGARELRRGPGHLHGSALPGETGNCIIAGHRDTHFRVLKDLKKGDDIVLETRGGQYLYRVKNLKVISPKDLEPLQPTKDPQLNLITCYPFYYVGSAPKRFVVQAQLAGAVSSATAPTVPTSWSAR